MSYSGNNTPSSSPRFWSTDTLPENRENLPPPENISTQPDNLPDENRGVLVQPSPGFAVRLIKPKTKLQLSRDVRRELRNTDTPSILQPVQEALEEENTSSPRIRPINIISISSSKYFDSPSSFNQSAGAPLPNIPISHPISLASRMEASENETPAAHVPFPDPPESIMEFSNEETDLPENIGTFLLESCLTQSWTSVDNQLKILDKAFRFDGKREAIVNAVNTTSEETGYTPLMLCVKESRLHEVTILTKLGANVNAVSKAGETVLTIATEHAKDDVVQLLVNIGADATVPEEATGRLALHIACSRKVASWPIVQILLPVSGEEGRLALDKDGFMPIWRAAEAGNPHVVKELLMALAPQQLSYQNKLQNGDSVMHYVLRQNNSELLRILIEAGGPVDIQNDDGQTLLHIATHTHNDSVLGLLHDYKANPEIADRYQRTALHLAVENGVTNVVETLTEKFKGSIMARTQDGSTLAHLAALTGHPDATIALLKRGVPLNMPNKSGALALHAAARTGHVRVTGILIENGSPVDAKTNENYTALHLAVEYGKPQVTEALLGYGASVDVKGGAAGETPLHIAARVPNGELCAEMLIKSGADVNNTMENGETAMHVAARFGALRMVQILLLEEANPLATSASGETALHVAVRACNYFVVKELIEHVANKQSRNDATNMVNAQNLVSGSN
ncbi:hypothetical protein RvY_09867-3 [Ramazzottius varieornatus]|uniref:Uncharacterized protein n=1 Tax=Ramazzottius varieornatus TaxID=947166 RepID=A0A1D1VAV3_RAMVA|nr:hypothetical protein RvY_09867-3 [Ramazzottius varieornatus]